MPEYVRAVDDFSVDLGSVHKVSGWTLQGWETLVHIPAG